VGRTLSRSRFPGLALYNVTYTIPGAHELPKLPPLVAHELLTIRVLSIVHHLSTSSQDPGGIVKTFIARQKFVLLYVN